MMANTRPSFSAASPDAVPDLVALVADGPVPRLKIGLAGEALEKGPVDAVLRHPVEMALDGLRVPRREQEGLLSVCVLEARGRVQFRWRVLREIRPEVRVRTTAVGDGVVEPV